MQTTVYHNNTPKTYNIPDDVIKHYMDTLDITEKEAVELWLDDNDITVNEEQENLDKKAKAVKIQHNAQAEAKKERKPREKKENPTKKTIISAIVAGLTTKIGDNAQITVRNDEKYIDFTLDNVEYTINLVAHRAKKSKNST